MADVNERVEAEFENIEKLLSELPAGGSYSHFSVLERAGLATVVHNFYNGVENILKQIIRHRGIELPSGPSWHRDLVNLAASSEIISEATAKELRRYLAFRHFFSHGYAFELNGSQIEPLVRDAGEIFKRFRTDVTNSFE